MTRLHNFHEILTNFFIEMQALMFNSSIQSFGSYVPSSYNTFSSQYAFRRPFLSTMQNQSTNTKSSQNASDQVGV